jgi:glycosyltransferase involved in cell wall biosynthesis
LSNSIVGEPGEQDWEVSPVVGKDRKIFTIALITRGRILAGAERQMLYIAEGLDRRRFSPHVVTFYDGPVYEEARAKGIPTTVVQRRGRSLWQDPTMPGRLARVLASRRIDLVYSWVTEANVFSAFACVLLPRVGLIASERGSSNSRNRMASILFARMLSWRAQRIIANSEAGRSFATALGMRPDRVVVIPNGIPLSRVAVPSVERDQVWSQFGLPADSEVIFNAARLYHQKDHVTLLRAFEIVAAGRPTARLVVAGEGDLRSGLEKLTASLGLSERVRWLGESDRIGILLAASRVAVLSSQDGEGMSNFLIEALLAGRRVVATDVGGTADVVRGTDSILVPARSPAQLAQALLAALTEDDGAEREALRREISRRRFSLEACLQATEGVLNDVLDRAGQWKKRG